MLVPLDIKAAVAKERKESPEFRTAYDALKQARTVARALAELRDRAGLSQADLAARMRTSQAAVSRMESPSYEGHTWRAISRYANALGWQPTLGFVISAAKKHRK